MDGAQLFAMTTAHSVFPGAAGVVESARAAIPTVRAKATLFCHKRPELVRSDVAAALAWGKGKNKLHDGAYYLGLVKFCDAQDNLGELERRLWLVAVDLVRTEPIDMPRGSELLRHHARYAIHEVVGTNRCSVCNGTGFQHQKPCGVCKGSGRVRLTQRRLAAMAGMPLASWQRKLKPIYDVLVWKLNRWEAAVLQHVEHYSCDERMKF